MKKIEACEIAQWVKVLSVIPKDLSSISTTDMQKRELIPTKVPLITTHTSWQKHIHTLEQKI